MDYTGKAAASVTVKRITEAAAGGGYIASREIRPTAKDKSVITLTFLVLLVCLAWLARTVWQHARPTILSTAAARAPAAIGHHGSAAPSIA